MNIEDLKFVKMTVEENFWKKLEEDLMVKVPNHIKNLFQ